MTATYGFEVNPVDLSVALDCEADRAEREHLPAVMRTQRATALHLRNAVHHLGKLCPPGHRVTVRIVVSHEPDVNPVLLDKNRD